VKSSPRLTHLGLVVIAETIQPRPSLERFDPFADSVG
jgi:hypothetical protein